MSHTWDVIVTTVAAILYVDCVSYALLPHALFDDECSTVPEHLITWKTLL